MVFQFVSIGNDAEGLEFLRGLDEDSSVSQCVDTISGSDLMDLMAMRAAEGRGFEAGDLQKVAMHRTAEGK